MKCFLITTFFNDNKGASIYICHLVLALSLGLPSPPIPSFSGIRKVMKFLSNLSIKCWNSAFNAQGWRIIIIVVVQLRAVKIYAATSNNSGGAQRKKGKERQDEAQFTTKIVGKTTSLGPSYFVFCRNGLFLPPLGDELYLCSKTLPN